MSADNAASGSGARSSGMLREAARYCASLQGFLIFVAPAAALLTAALFVFGAVGNPFPGRDPIMSTAPILLGYAFCSLTFGVLVMEWQSEHSRIRSRADLDNNENRNVLYVVCGALSVFVICSVLLAERVGGFNWF